MGMIVSVYRNCEFGDCTNGGISSRFTRLCVVNVDGPFKPNEKTPAVMLQSHVKGCLRIVPATAVDNIPNKYVLDDSRWYMSGGNYATTSDSRFGEACYNLLGQAFYGAVAIHDRIES